MIELVYCDGIKSRKQCVQIKLGKFAVMIAKLKHWCTSQFRYCGPVIECRGDVFAEAMKLEKFNVRE